MKYLRTRIVEVEYPARDHALLRFAGDEAIPATPGEFVMVRGDWGVHPVLPRAFSLVESGTTGAILVKAIGEGTERLAAMTVGEELVVFGPLGRPYDVDADRHPVLVAGGVGVAPLLFLARGALHLPLRRSHGARPTAGIGNCQGSRACGHHRGRFAGRARPDYVAPRAPA